MCDGGRSNINFISLITSGLLTGKYKRGEKLDSTSGRIAYISNDEKGASEAGPAWSKYANNESYWKLMSVMEDVAKIHGILYIILY
jgi:hypothetical protein